MMKFAFVVDLKGNKLMPTKEQKAWYLIRKGRATLLNKYPLVIQLKKEVKISAICKNEVRCGIDDGGLHVGIALVQKCTFKNKVVFKGTIELRSDVKRLMETRKGYRKLRRSHKRYRPRRFNNRSSAKRKGRVAPSILQKRQAIVRVVDWLSKWSIINSYWLEDVSIDIRALTDGYKPYKWKYCHSNRLDENIRKAVIMRDGSKCKECGKSKCKLEVHHIKPKRLNGSNTVSNLITLCEKCHQKTEGREEEYMEKYFSLLKTSDNKNLNYASHVMIGKSWLRTQLMNRGSLHLTSGGDTSNTRIDWGIEKSHCNDAICITKLKPSNHNLKEWIIKPIRRQSKSKGNDVLGIKHRDYVEYTFRNGDTHRGYVTALYPHLNALNFQSPTKHCKKINAKKCKLLWRFTRIYWLERD